MKVEAYRCDECKVLLDENNENLCTIKYIKVGKTTIEEDKNKSEPLHLCKNCLCKKLNINNSTLRTTSKPSGIGDFLN